jgi:hypothetical protein
LGHLAQTLAHQGHQWPLVAKALEGLLLVEQQL